ncbi:unnamed protein product [Vitrella brassicaformis CCMP3155]|uniref:Uncharacterized protein n=1 Tax=Vitrella brassicaformis (strain CCMP3155) TaxID=1169540 RepID=A0A0G4H7S8_VITBC|nr:unnamed protein product [Vitrella brassicaformis CCMP3155]|eukprot:CEM39931.1 unnamed protein product [Vitrella brassicaformis CCMP3155]
MRCAVSSTGGGTYASWPGGTPYGKGGKGYERPGKGYGKGYGGKGNRRRMSAAAANTIGITADVSAIDKAFGDNAGGDAHVRHLQLAMDAGEVSAPIAEAIGDGDAFAGEGTDFRAA